MNLGDLITPAPWVDYLHLMSAPANGFHSCQVRRGSIGIVLEPFGRRVLERAGCREVHVMFGGKCGWCYENELVVISEPR